MRRVLNRWVCPLLVAAVAALPQAALGAAPSPAGPPDAATFAAGSFVDFSASVGATDFGGIQLVVSTGPTVDAAGLLVGDEVVARRLVVRAPGSTSVTDSVRIRRPGTYWWQFTIQDPAVPGGVAAAPARALTVTTTAQAPGPIPTAVGASATGSFLVNPAALPPGVSAARFAALASSSGSRWGFTYAGLTDRPPTQVDDVTVVGFSAEIDPDALGVLVSRRGTKALPQVCTAGTRAERRVVTRRVVRRVKVRRTVVVRRDGRAVRVRVARTVRRPVPVRRTVDVSVPTRSCVDQPPAAIVDRDIRLSLHVRWEEGPGYPSGIEHDLESVLIHEFGHLAGNPHTPDPCHPMAAALSTGEWWRGPADYWLGDCPSPGPGF